MGNTCCKGNTLLEIQIHEKMGLTTQKSDNSSIYPHYKLAYHFEQHHYTLLNVSVDPAFHSGKLSMKLEMPISIA